MGDRSILSDDRLFPAEPAVRDIARRLYAGVRGLPIVSPHGHTDPAWFADDRPFADPASLLVVPDHYVYRMLYSQGVALESLGVPRRDGAPVEGDSREIWRVLARHWHLLRGTPSRLWLTHVLADVFGVREKLTPDSADRIHDRIADCLGR
ncbi:MAG TPA: glucuronate isomerase, partial [Polyangiaceae bacterium]|nr:glucuronate isomerase [Polyangiaceae bacterium]